MLSGVTATQCISVSTSWGSLEGKKELCRLFNFFSKDIQEVTCVHLPHLSPLKFLRPQRAPLSHLGSQGQPYTLPTCLYTAFAL